MMSVKAGESYVDICDPGKDLHFKVFQILGELELLNWHYMSSEGVSR